MPRKKANIHYIYKTTCLVTGRYYIGMHSTANIDDGYMGSGKRLRHSIRKYSAANHKKEILEFFDTREMLIEAEKKAITPDMVADINCMNLKEGGTGGFVNEEHRIKFRDSAKKTQIQFILEDANIARKHNESSSKRMKKLHQDGIINYATFTNKSHSIESKKLMSESKKGKKMGVNNSQYNTCWITKDGVNKKIKNTELYSFIKDGWTKGRKIK